MSLILVDQDKCQKDGICSAVCPLGLIAWQKGDHPRPIPEAEDLCIACGHCVAACPHGALDHRDMASAACPPLRPELALDPQQVEHFLRSRRSIRVYRDQAPPRETIAELIRLASHAPSGHNIQPTHWLVLSQREELQRLAGMVIAWMQVVKEKNRALFDLLHMDRVIARWQAGEDVILRGAPTLVVAHAPKEERTAPPACTIALAYLELAAPAFGLGACWAGYFNAAASTYPPLADALRLPQGHGTFGAMMLGYPKHRYHRLPLRRPPRITWR